MSSAKAALESDTRVRFLLPLCSLLVGLELFFLTMMRVLYLECDYCSYRYLLLKLEENTKSESTQYLPVYFVLPFIFTFSEKKKINT